MNDLHTITRTPPRRIGRLTLTAGALTLAAAAAFAVPAAPAVAQADKLDQVVGALRGITTMRSNFTQTDRSGQSVSGVLTLKQPGRIRFAYGKGVDMCIASNGSGLTLADYDVRQLESWPIGNSPLGALLDPKRDVKRYGKLLPTSNPNVISVEVKDPKKPEYGTITLIFTRDGAAPGGLELNSWVAMDAQNKRTTVRLSNHQYGVQVANSLFSCPDPRRTTRRPR